MLVNLPKKVAMRIIGQERLVLSYLSTLLGRKPKGLLWPNSVLE